MALMSACCEPAALDAGKKLQPFYFIHFPSIFLSRCHYECTELITFIFSGDRVLAARHPLESCSQPALSGNTMRPGHMTQAKTKKEITNDRGVKGGGRKQTIVQRKKDRQTRQ